MRDRRFKHFLNKISYITKDLSRLPQAVFVSNRKYGLYPMKEAMSLLIPVVSIFNSNTKPDWAAYWLPGNDKSPGSLAFFFELLDILLVVLKLKRLVRIKTKFLRKTLEFLCD